MEFLKISRETHRRYHERYCRDPWNGLWKVVWRAMEGYSGRDCRDMWKNCGELPKGPQRPTEGCHRRD